jgi:alpha-beta hydrolase superfamily lysophospholipase
VLLVQQSDFILTTPDGVDLFVYRWLAERAPKAAVQIAHGMAEHAGRYARLAESLTKAGCAVYANDHRGHGRTAKSPGALGLVAEDGGWQRCIDDLWLLNRTIPVEHPGVPIILLGHSMGATMAQQFIAEHGQSLAGAVLSGPSGQPTRMADLGRLIARIERLRLGRRGHSRVIHNLTFAEFNKQFAPVRTEFDWLSRDTAEVDKYVADPLCGFSVSAQLWVELLDAWKRISRADSMACVPKELPLYVIAGSRNAVSAGIRQLEPMLEAYRAAGLTNLEHRTYPDARHELFNETNRDEVTRDLISWLESVTRRSI